MTNKTKAAVWTLILFISLLFLAVLTVLFTKAFLLLLILGLFGVIVKVIYDEILSELNN